jgi:hypothetical protein
LTSRNPASQAEIGEMAVTCPVAGDGPDDEYVELLLSIDGPRHRNRREFPLDHHLRGRVGLTAIKTWSDRRVLLAAEVEKSERTERRHQFIFQEIVPTALEYAATGEEEPQDASSDGGARSVDR